MMRCQKYLLLNVAIWGGGGLAMINYRDAGFDTFELYEHRNHSISLMVLGREGLYNLQLGSINSNN